MARPATIILRSGELEYSAAPLDDARVQVGDETIEVVEGIAGSVRAGGRVAWTAGDASTRWVFLDGDVHVFEIQRGGPGRRRGGSHHGSLAAPMPATVRRIAIAVGDRVTRGQTLIVLEAMKMELPVKAATDATVEAINCQEGELVQPGVELIGLLENEDA